MNNSNDKLLQMYEALLSAGVFEDIDQLLAAAELKLGKFDLRGQDAP